MECLRPSLNFYEEIQGDDRGIVEKGYPPVVDGDGQMKFFEWLDAKQFLRMKTWDFSFRSLAQEYGRDFILKVILRHPLRTIRGIHRYRNGKSRPSLSENTALSRIESRKDRWEGDPIVGVGFCLKPLDPPCLSGRANHDCFFLERNLHRSDSKIPSCCQHCRIREIGLLSLKSNTCFYIMTSAKDILYDLILPTLEKNAFSRGAFVICRYSFEPFDIALAIAGISGRLFPYEKNDCQDYSTWLLADIGIKEQQTEIHETCFTSIREELAAPDARLDASLDFIKKGNLFYPS